MAHGKYFGKLPVSTQVILVVAGLAAVGTIGYVVYKHIQKKKVTEGAKDLAANVDLTSGGLGAIAKEIPKSKLADVTKQLKSFDVKQIGDLIYDAHGVFNDDEDAVYFAFSRLKNRAELTLLSEYFKKLYKIDLFIYIQGWMNPTELTKINDIVKKLPTY